MITCLVSSFEHYTLILDNAASHDMTSLFSLLKDIRTIHQPLQITVPISAIVLVDKIGTMNLGCNIKLHNVLYIPQFTCNLIFIHKLTSISNCTVTYSPTICVIQDQTMKKTIGYGDLRDGVYVLR